LKMLTETLLIIPFSVTEQCSPVSTHHWLQEKYARINLSQAALDFTEYQATSCMHLQGQNSCFRVFEDGY
jgi:hypothetical protein